MLFEQYGNIDYANHIQSPPPPFSSLNPCFTVTAGLADVSKIYVLPGSRRNPVPMKSSYVINAKRFYQAFFVRLAFLQNIQIYRLIIR